MSKKARTKKHDTFIDMTAMSDVTVLLLTFFMLTANFIPKEPVQVFTPQSVSEFKVPDFDVMTILIDPEGRVYFNLDRPEDKKRVLTRMGERHRVSFTARELDAFAIGTSFAGVPMNMMKTLLSKDASDQEAMVKEHGIPTDSLNNQLAEWITVSREINENLSIAIKADQTTAYPLVKNVMTTLQEIHENRFSLLTSLRGMPEGF